MMANYTTWLTDTTAIRCILVEAVSNTSSTDITHFLSTKPFIDGAAGRSYDPIVASHSIQLIERISIDGSPSMSVGDIELHNNDGSLDAWLTHIWTNKPVTILIGDVRWFRSDFVTIFNGTIDDIDSRSWQTLNIKVRDKLQRLNTPLSEEKLGGTAINKNELIPLCFGECFNVTPLLSNPATLEYQVHNGAIEGIIEVRDNGVPVTATKNLTSGKFTLTTQPFGKVTASVQGDKPTTWNTTVSKTIQRIVTAFGGSGKLTSSDLDLIQLTNFDSANNQPIGLYVDNRENTLSVCNAIASSVGAQLVMSRLGQLQLLKIELPATGTPFQIGVEDIVQDSMNITKKLPIKASYKVNYNKNWTIQPTLLTGIPEEHKKMYSTEYLSETSIDSVVRSEYKLDAEPVAIDTLLLTTVAASSEATRLLNLFKVPRFIVSFVGSPRLTQLTLGQAVTLTYPRFGMNSGKPGQVIGLSINWNDLTVQTEVLV